jgi:all-trans-8'-apo-beta-carotenal 15,15'-oxygenase
MSPSSADMERVLAAATQTVEEELTDVALPVQGELPAAIDGCYFRNGPGRFERGGQRYRHPFDGDGHITKLDLRDGAGALQQPLRAHPRIPGRGAHRTHALPRLRHQSAGRAAREPVPAQLQERRQHQRALARRAAARALGGRRALSLDPTTLATLGTEDFGGGLASPFSGLSRWLAPLLPFSAHPTLDAASGELHNFGLVSGRPNLLMLYRIGADGRMDSPSSTRWSASASCTTSPSPGAGAASCCPMRTST